MVHHLASINQLEQDAFVNVLGPVFEETPAIAQAVWRRRPFPSKQALHRAMVEQMLSLSVAQQLALLRAHPDLGSRAKMAPASVEEQKSVHLDQLTPAEFDRLLCLNQTYTDRFGFPFIIAVKQQTKASIFAALEVRLGHDLAQEQAIALAEIAQIAWFRLDDWVNDD